MNNLTKKDIESTIDKLENEFYNQYHKLVKEVFNSKVIPFCKKYKLSFTSGMGTYFFITKRKTYLDDIRSRRNNLMSSKSKNNGLWKEYDELISLLEINSSYVKTNPIGAEMEDYNA